jgi:hypothetical protein
MGVIYVLQGTFIPKAEPSPPLSPVLALSLSENLAVLRSPGKRPLLKHLPEPWAIPQATAYTRSPARLPHDDRI